MKFKSSLILALVVCGLLGAQIDLRKISDCSILYRLAQHFSKTGDFSVDFPVINGHEFYLKEGKKYYLRPPGYALMAAGVDKVLPDRLSLIWQDIFVSLICGVMGAGLLTFVFAKMTKIKESGFIAVTVALGSPLTVYLTFLWHESMGAVVLALALACFHLEKKYWGAFFGGLTLLFSQFAFVTATTFFGTSLAIDIFSKSKRPDKNELWGQGLAFGGAVGLMSLVDTLLLGTPLPLQSLSPIDISLSPTFLRTNLYIYFISGASLTKNFPVFLIILFVPFIAIFKTKLRKEFLPLVVSSIFSLISLLLNLSYGECQVGPRHMMPLVVLGAYSFLCLAEMAPEISSWLRWILGPLALISIFFGIMNSSGYLANCDMTTPTWAGTSFFSIFELSNKYFPLRVWGYGLAALAILFQVLLSFPIRRHREY